LFDRRVVVGEAGFARVAIGGFDDTDGIGIIASTSSYWVAGLLLDGVPVKSYVSN